MERTLIAGVAALALLCACGGGGGTTPAAPVPSSSASSAAGQTLSAGSTAQTATFTGAGAYTSATVNLPATTGAGGSVNVQLAASAPSGVPAAQSLRRTARTPATIGGTLSPIAYVSVTPATTMTLASALTFAFVLASVPAGTNYYVGSYDPTQAAAGWTTYLGPGSVSGSTVGFASVPAPITLTAGVTYVFALVSTGQALAPHATTQTFSGGGSLAATFAVNFPAAAHSGIFTFTPPSGPPQSTLVVLPANCPGASSCTVTLSAPAGANQSLQALLFASADGSGPALALGTGTVSMFAGQTTTLAVPLAGIMASFTLALSPSSVTAGTNSPIVYTENALDAAGESLAAGFVNANLQPPVFNVTVADPAGASTPAMFSGIDGGPIAYTATTVGLSATASLTVTAAPAASLAFALQNNGLSTCSIGIYAASGGMPVRHYIPPSCNRIVFDKNGTLWLLKSDLMTNYGITSNGTPAGTLGAPGQLLTFDANGNAYTLGSGNSTVNEYSGSTLVRQINTPQTPISAAVDPSGNVYIGMVPTGAGSGSTIEYPATGTGSLTPIASSTAVLGVSIDGSGTVYGYAGGGVGIDVWNAGTFGSEAPARVISIPPSLSLSAIGVDSAGDVFGVTSNAFMYVALSGASSMSSLAGTYPSSDIPDYLSVVPH